VSSLEGDNLVVFISVHMKFDPIRGVSFDENGLIRRVRVMVLNATFNNISVISWRSVLLVEETGEYSTPRDERDSNSQL
jgi:hypothetical protein